MALPTQTAPLTGCVSIDATSPDGYLDNARAGTPTAGAHNSIQTAAANLLACAGETASPTTASLVGHGEQGIISTGAGQSLGSSLQHIGLDNQAVWVPAFQTLSGRFSTLYLYAPHVGAGVAGAQLLYALAKVLNANVYGPTGLIYSNAEGDFSLEIGSQWQVAMPTGRPPSPIDPPVHPVGDASTSGSGVRISACSAFGLKGVPLPAKSAKALAGKVYWDRVFQAPGEPGARITGRLRVSFGGTAFRAFTILGNGLLREDDRPTNFYPVGPGFRAIALGR